MMRNERTAGPGERVEPPIPEGAGRRSGGGEGREGEKRGMVWARGGWGRWCMHAGGVYSLEAVVWGRGGLASATDVQY